MTQITDKEFEALLDHADEVAELTWSQLVGHDCTAGLHVIGTLLFAIERELGWPREDIIEAVCAIADGCKDDDEAPALDS